VIFRYDAPNIPYDYPCFSVHQSEKTKKHQAFSFWKALDSSGGALQFGGAFIFWPGGLRIRPGEPRFGAGFAIRRVLQCLPPF
jgi:hypothetical protein